MNMACTQLEMVEAHVKNHTVSGTKTPSSNSKKMEGRYLEYYLYSGSNLRRESIIVYKHVSHLSKKKKKNFGLRRRPT